MTCKHLCIMKDKYLHCSAHHKDIFLDKYNHTKRCKQPSLFSIGKFRHKCFCFSTMYAQVIDLWEEYPLQMPIASIRIDITVRKKQAKGLVKLQNPENVGAFFNKSYFSGSSSARQKTQSSSLMYSETTLNILIGMKPENEEQYYGFLPLQNVKCYYKNK